MFSVKHTHLLAEGKNFKTEIVARTKERTEKEEKAGKIWGHKPRLISYLIRPDAGSIHDFPALKSFGDTQHLRPGLSFVGWKVWRAYFKSCIVESLRAKFRAKWKVFEICGGCKLTL